MNPFGPILTYLILFVQICCHLEQFEALWTNLDAIGPIERMTFFVLRDCMLFFCPKRLRFFCPSGEGVYLSVNALSRPNTDTVQK